MTNNCDCDGRLKLLCRVGARRSRRPSPFSLSSPPPSRARLTAIHPSSCLSFLARLLDFSVDFSLDFGFRGLFFLLSLRLLPGAPLQSLPVPASAGVRNPDSKDTCMSDISILQNDLRELTAAVKELTLAVRARPVQRVNSQRGASASVSSEASRLWELVENSGGIPGAPANFLEVDLEIQFEDGPGPTPQFCIDSAKRHLTSARHHSEDRARAAFVAGFWAKAFWACNSPYPSTYRPGIPATHWVLRRGPGFDLVRVTSQADSNRLCKDFPEIEFVEKVPSLTELHIFCAGAKAPVPPLWKWTGDK